MGIAVEKELPFMLKESKLSFKEQVLLNAIYNFNIENPGQKFSYSNKAIASDIFYLDPVDYNARYVSRLIGALVSKKLVKCVYIDDNPRNKRLDIVLSLTDDQIHQLIKEKEKHVDYENYLVLEKQKNSVDMLETFWINQTFCYQFDLDLELGSTLSFLWLIHAKKLKVTDGYEEVTPDINGWFNAPNELFRQFLPSIFRKKGASEEEKIKVIVDKLKALVEANMIEVNSGEESSYGFDRQIRLTTLGSQYFKNEQ